MNREELKLEQLKRIISKSHHLVCVIGTGMPGENGYPVIQDSDWAYDMEIKYRYTPEEILDTSFFSTRKEQFFEFYRNEILSWDIPPNDAYKALVKLERKGILSSIITTNIYSLPIRAGSKCCIELYGNIFINYCSHCRKRVDFDKVRNTPRIPVCKKCHSYVRPGIFLFGERIDNQVMTKAMEEISKADLLLVCGGNLHSPNISSFCSYFSGEKIVIINEEPHYSDEKATLAIYDKVVNVLPKVVGI